MRTASAGELTILESADYDVYWYAEVKNGSGTWKNLSSLGGTPANYLQSCTIEEDIDQFTAQATVELRRDSGGADPTLSVAPLKTDSTLNVLDDGVTYSPLLDVSREFRIYIGTVAGGAAAPSGADWKLKFHGYIDAIDWDHSPAIVTCRDLGGRLLDTWIESEASFGNEVDSLETVLQAILDSYITSPGVTLWTPAASSHAPKSRKVYEGSVFDWMKTLVDEIGWDLRYRFRASSGAYELALTAPNRTGVTADYTWAPSKYIDIEKLTLEGAEIRNAVKITYGNATPRASTTRTDATSITKYRRRFMEAIEPRITNATIAETLGDRIVLDLKDPKGELQAVTFTDWRLELGDLYDFSDNNIHFNTTQQLGVNTVRHELRKDAMRTSMGCSGKPKGQCLNWLTRGTRAEEEVVVRPPLALVQHVSGTTTSETVSYTGTLAPGAIGPISMRRKIDVVDAAGSYGAGATSIANEAITRDKSYNKEVTLEVTDSHTGLISFHTFTVAAELVALDRTTGKVDRGTAMDTGEFIPKGNSDGDLTGDISGDTDVKGGGSVFIPDTDAVVYGTAASPTTKEKYYYIPFLNFFPENDTQTWINTSGYLTPNSVAAVAYRAEIQVPPGATITELRGSLWKNAAGDATAVQIKKVSDAGVITNVGSGATLGVTGAWTDVTESLSEVVASDRSYYVEAALNNTVAVGNSRVTRVRITYTVPDYKTTV